jgi:hypothetical protein
MRNVAIPAQKAGRADLLALWTGQSANLAVPGNLGVVAVPCGWRGEAIQSCQIDFLAKSVVREIAKNVFRFDKEGS